MAYDVSEQPAQDQSGWAAHGQVPPRHAGADWLAGGRPADQPAAPRGGPAAGAHASAAYPGYDGPGHDGDPRRAPDDGGYPAGYPAAPPPAGGPAGYGWGGPAEPYLPSPPEPYREAVTRSHDPAAAELRSQVVRRIRFMNFRHAEHAWERRYRDPLGPHALAFLYSEPPRGTPPRYTLRTATRLFLAGPEVDDLPRLLQDLATVVARQQPGGADPRALADRSEDMTANAFYVGLAVSSLDTPAAPWAYVRQRAAGSIDVPGRCYAVLTDDSMVLMDRGGESQFGHFAVRATDSLDEIPGESMQRWTYDRTLRDLTDPGTSDNWRGLLSLHNTIVGRGSDEYWTPR
jgi:hypothetical protein